MAQGISGRAPFGFRWQDGGLSVVEGEAALRRLMCELFMEHQTKAGVAEALSAMGHYTRTGADWRDSTVGRLLSCASAIGTYFANKTTTAPEGQRIEFPRDQWEAVPCPAIVDRSLRENVQALLRVQIWSGIKTSTFPGRAPAFGSGRMRLWHAYANPDRVGEICLHILLNQNFHC